MLKQFLLMGKRLRSRTWQSLKNLPTRKRRVIFFVQRWGRTTNDLLRTSWVPIICQNERDLSATNRTLTQMLTQILTPSSIQFDRNPRCYVVKNLNRVISDPVQRQNPSSSKLPARVRILTFLGSHWTLPSLPSYLIITVQTIPR